MDQNWLKVLAASVFEVLWVIGLAHAEHLWEWTGTLFAILISNYLLIKASQKLPGGTVYSVFVGLGTGGTVLSEILFFHQPFQWKKIFFIAILLTGVIGLKLVTDQERTQEAEN